MLWIILLGVALIDAKLWKLVLEQRRHNTVVEQLLTDIRDRNRQQEGSPASRAA